MTRADWVFLDGEFLLASEAKISPFDRGYLFAQAVYEVTAVYDGAFIDLESHLARFERSLAGIEVEIPDLDLAALHHEIIEKNALTEGLVYLQASAGDQGPRDYYGPETLMPSVFMFATHKQLIGDVARDGIMAISYEDTRWARRDYKTTQLLTQTLAYRAARRAGAHTAIMHEDGLVTEAASANLWIVTQDGLLVTRELSSALLPGITRARLLSLLGRDGLRIEERAFSLEELLSAQEAFTSSTGVVIAPVLSLDGTPIGSGKPGAVTRQVQSAYYGYIGADLRQLNWL
ncbi:MAG: aminotransferase class IV [Pseudomonadota bacterium]